MNHVLKNNYNQLYLNIINIALICTILLFVVLSAFRISLLVAGAWKDQSMVNHQSFLSLLLNMS